ncbi:MAG: hypothetical protein FD173_1545 [Gallionellaceae bacterium]|nr:MAG: hypothetical protein FD173_1545 [Gallionellaceae bacterium]
MLEKCIFFHKPLFVRADRLVADDELIGDLIDSFAGNQQAKNLKLPIRKMGMRNAMLIRQILKHHLFGHYWINILTTVGHFANRVKQDCWIFIFGNIAKNPGLERPND